MRVFLGMILGAVLTVAAAYSYDSIGTSLAAASASGRSAATNHTMVNWDVVEANWNRIKTRARDGWDKLAVKIDRG